MQPKHQKITNYKKQEDGSTIIDTKSYYEELSQELIEIEKNQVSSFISLKKDVEQALEHITNDGSPQLVLTIKVVNNQPRITKRWVTLKRNYPRQ